MYPYPSPARLANQSLDYQGMVIERKDGDREYRYPLPMFDDVERGVCVEEIDPPVLLGPPDFAVVLSVVSVVREVNGCQHGHPEDPPPSELPYHLVIGLDEHVVGVVTALHHLQATEKGVGGRSLSGARQVVETRLRVPLLQREVDQALYELLALEVTVWC